MSTLHHFFLAFEYFNCAVFKDVKELEHLDQRQLYGTRVRSHVTWIYPLSINFVPTQVKRIIRSGMVNECMLGFNVLHVTPGTTS